MIRQGMLGQIYVGRVLDVDQEALKLQTFQQDGAKAAVWVISLSTITEFLTESRQLDTLALKVKWANSKDKSHDDDDTNLQDEEESAVAAAASSADEHSAENFS